MFWYKFLNVIIVGFFSLMKYLWSLLIHWSEANCTNQAEKYLFFCLLFLSCFFSIICTCNQNVLSEIYILSVNFIKSQKFFWRLLSRNIGTYFVWNNNLKTVKLYFFNRIIQKKIIDVSETYLALCDWKQLSPKVQ